MSPLRILILGGLLYLLYRLVSGGRRRLKTTRPPNWRPAPLSDVLVEDPVCHIYIPKGHAVTLDQNGTIYHFCSKKCRETFRTEQGGSA